MSQSQTNCQRSALKKAPQPATSRCLAENTDCAAVFPDCSPAITCAFRHAPFSNLGITTGSLNGLLVVDVDPKNGGHKSLAKLATVRSLAAGCHCCHWRRRVPHLLGRPADRVPTSAGTVAPGVDIRACAQLWLFGHGVLVHFASTSPKSMCGSRSSILPTIPSKMRPNTTALSQAVRMLLWSGWQQSVAANLRTWSVREGRNSLLCPPPFGQQSQPAGLWRRLSESAATTP